MPDSTWALLDGEPSGGTPPTVADRLVSAWRDAPSPAAAAALLAEWGAFVRALPEREAFVATADNVAAPTTDGAGLALVRPGRDELTPLDSAATAARVCWHLARTVVAAGASPAPDHTVEELAVRLAGPAGFAFDRVALDRALADEATELAATTGATVEATHEQLRTESAWTAADALGAGAIEPAHLRAALTAAWRDLAIARVERDAAESEAVEAAAARALAQSLGDQLERDEWIRARLRKAKGTRPARAVISARKRVLRREA